MAPKTDIGLYIWNTNLPKVEAEHVLQQKKVVHLLWCQIHLNKGPSNKHNAELSVKF